MSKDVTAKQEAKQEQGTVIITDFCDVSAKAQLLGLNVPKGLAFLPRNFEYATTFDELLHESEVPTLRSLFRQHDIPETKFERHDQKIPYIVEKHVDLVLPAIFVGELILSQSPHLLSLSLNIIANYVTDCFKDSPGRQDVGLKVIKEEIVEEDGKRRKRYQKIDYEGPVEGLAELTKIVSEDQ